MVVTCVNVTVLPEHIADFIQATIANHQGSIQEPSNLRFDLLQDPEQPTQFVLYEAYADSEGAAQHKQTAHYKIWRETVAPWMAKPREGKPYTVIAP
ncbi:antibiotic biosynthesis monooxygenase [filamentous cyanobacterium LEGE 11480]|uniref:Antibiotic biosynthesis monooxygenase n=1 Tax=Romeriopsis navalis LEGE 11480 TaxID=2777977 RepID=A0A928Z4B1_9CYAN|nr:antibiotic biosynthesis monooxygenase [Romeriopsis navalis]MBE9031579.1 antibiotic biosynthesis monooxygenase [Romeriopsis navalis LEGE 11480]